MKRLYKSESNKVFTGVIGGLGEYLDTDPVVLRLTWIGIVVFTGLIPGIIIYLVAVFIVPSPPKKKSK